MLTEKGLLNQKLAGNLLSWKHSGFSIDNSVRIFDRQAQVNLAEYISRPPIPPPKIRYEPFKGRVLFHTVYSDYFKENVHLFEALEFIAELTQHIPTKGLQLIRRYGLYSSRIKGHWEQLGHISRRAPAGWRQQHGQGTNVEDDQGFEPLSEAEEVDSSEYKHAWARLLAKVYEVDPFVCPRMHGRAGNRRFPTSPGVDRK